MSGKVLCFRLKNTSLYVTLNHPDRLSTSLRITTEHVFKNVCRKQNCEAGVFCIWGCPSKPSKPFVPRLIGQPCCSYHTCGQPPGLALPLAWLHTPTQAGISEGGDHTNRRVRNARPHCWVKRPSQTCHGASREGSGRKDIPWWLRIFKCRGLGIVSVCVCGGHIQPWG